MGVSESIKGLFEPERMDRVVFNIGYSKDGKRAKLELFIEGEAGEVGEVGMRIRTMLSGADRHISDLISQFSREEERKQEILQKSIDTVLRSLEVRNGKEKRPVS